MHTGAVVAQVVASGRQRSPSSGVGQLPPTFAQADPVTAQVPSGRQALPAAQAAASTVPQVGAPDGACPDGRQAWRCWQAPAGPSAANPQSAGPAQGVPTPTRGKNCRPIP